MGFNTVLACRPDTEDRCCPSAASCNGDQFPTQPFHDLGEANVDQLIDSTFSDEPASPQSIRAWRKQIKRVSRLHRQRSHNTISEASVTCAVGSGPVAWETAMGDSVLDRRSSTHSTGSSAPSQHVPESTRTFGKILFSRRVKSKRNDSSRNSSASSVYSVETSTDTGSGAKEFLPSIFSRRKAQRDEAAPKRLQISGPFNFQHVEHRLPEGRSMEASLTDGSGQGLGILMAPPGAKEAIDHRSISLPSRCIVEQVNAMDNAPHGRPGLVPRHTSPIPGFPRLTKLALSRNTRARSSSAASNSRSHTPSPTLSTFSSSTLPLRRSSRWVTRPKIRNLVALHNEAGLEMEEGTMLAQSPVPESRDVPGPQTIISHDHLIPLDAEAAFAHGGFCEVTKPLPPLKPSLYDRELPKVPEEDEQQGHVIHHSSLRGSQSTPLMRSASECKWPLAEATTSSHADPIVVEPLRCPEVEARVRMNPPLRRESWEDDIDYCYEHEAEADCNYQWDRPSMETTRDFDRSSISTPVLRQDVLEMNSSRSAFARRESNLPDLSPASQGSVEYSHGPITPTFCTPMGNDSSLARVNAKNPQSLDLDCSGRDSDDSPYKESQFFDLSPSLLIPGEFQQELVLAETNFHEQCGIEGFTGPYRRSAFYEDSASTDGYSLENYPRRSFSTTAESSFGSDSTETRHMSAVSSRTALTQHTASSTSLNKMAGPDLACSDIVPELIPLPVCAGARRCNHRSHASEPSVLDEAATQKSTESPRCRRQRARTASLSNQMPPPVGQYAIFPRAYVKLTGDMI